MSFSSDPAILVNQLPLSVDFPRDHEKFLETLTLIYKRIANSVNTKTGGLFSLSEIFDSEQIFITSTPNQFRNIYSKAFDVVSLNGAPLAPGTYSFPHNISGITACTHIYGTATNSDVPTIKYLPLPYVSTSALSKQIEIWLDPAKINIIVGSTQSTLTQCYIIAEYVKT